MRKTILSLLLVCASFAATAQDNLFHLGISGGYNIVFAKVGYTNNIATRTGPDGEDAKFKGLNLAVNAGINLRKWQIGIGVEAGSYKGDMMRQMIDSTELYKINYLSNQFGPYRFTDTAIGEQIASPYITPHVYVNFKQDFAEIISVYFGVMGGYVLGQSQITSDGKLNGWMAGGNLGVQLNLTDRISIDIHEGLRAAFIGTKNDVSPLINVDKDRPIDGRYYYITSDRFTFSFLSTNLGIVFKL